KTDKFTTLIVLFGIFTLVVGIAMLGDMTIIFHPPPLHFQWVRKYFGLGTDWATLQSFNIRRWASYTASFDLSFVSSPEFFQ
ncbi:unnamed protein product, partial [Aphanomyces euteiches]